MANEEKHALVWWIFYPFWVTLRLIIQILIVAGGILSFVWLTIFLYRFAAWMLVILLLVFVWLAGALWVAFKKDTGYYAP